MSRSLDPENADQRETLCWSLWVMAVGGSYMEILPEHWDEAEALLAEQASLIPRLGDNTQIDARLYQGYNLWLGAVLANNRRQYDRAKKLGLESVRLFEACGSDTDLVGPYITLGNTALGSGQPDRATDYFKDALRCSGFGTLDSFVDVRHGDILLLLCEAEAREGNLAEALDYCKLFLGWSYSWFAYERAEWIALILVRVGRFTEAARLSGAAEALSEQTGRPTSTKTHQADFWGDWRSRFADVSLDALVPDWRTRPDGGAILQAWNDGRSMTERQLIDLIFSLTI